jgi:hypothetical protein
MNKFNHLIYIISKPNKKTWTLETSFQVLLVEVCTILLYMYIKMRD